MNDLSWMKKKVLRILGTNGQINCSVIISFQKPILYVCRWKRDYPDAGLSDERPEIVGDSLEEVLLGIIRYEEQADIKDTEEAATA